MEKVAPSSWQIISYSYSGSLPAVIDDPLECLPPDMPKGDLFLYVGRDRKLAELIPDMAAVCKVKEVLAPVDARFFLPTGLANQIKRQLSKSGIPVAFPAPFCSLTGVTSEGRLIQEFARHFGKPQLKVNISNGRIEEVILRREAACGNTRYVA